MIELSDLYKMKFLGKLWLEDIFNNIQFDCDYAIIKGEVNSFYEFGKFGKRIYRDIDILVSRNNAPKIQDIFFNNGYECLQNRKEKLFYKMYSHQFPPLYNPKLMLQVDLNVNLFWGEYEGKLIDIEEFLSDTIEMEIYGVKVKTLPPIKAMIQLILHHYKDMNSIFLLATRKSIKYDMFKDVYYLLKNNLDTIPSDRLYAMSAEYEIIPYVFYVLYYTGQVFDDEILKQYIEAFRTPEGEALLNCYGLCAKERKEWKCDFKTRLDADNLYDLIKDDLTEKDHEKIAINKRIIMGVSE